MDSNALCRCTFMHPYTKSKPRSFYEGQFFNKRIEGVGKYYWADGRCFVGQWKEDTIHGEGDFRAYHTCSATAYRDKLRLLIESH